MNKWNVILATVALLAASVSLADEDDYVTREELNSTTPHGGRPR